MTLTPIAVSPAQAAELLGVSRWHIYDLINTGQLASAKSGTRVLVDYQALLDFYEGIRRTA